MIVPTKKLKQLIKLFPTQAIFAQKVSADEATLSRLVNDDCDVPKRLMENIMDYTGWPFDDLFEIVTEADRRKDD